MTRSPAQGQGANKIDSPENGSSKNGASKSAANTTHILLGKVTGVFGVRGWIKVFSDTQPRENITSYPIWWLQAAGGERRRYAVENGKRSGKYVVAKLEGIDDRDAADTIIGCSIAIERDAMPPLEKDEYYWNDLLGFSVTNLQGKVLGTVLGMLETGAHDILVVGTAGSEDTQDLLVPWVKEHFIKRVDVEQRTIVVDWELDWSV